MKRNLKVLGVALAAVFAMSAMGASAAQANLPEFTADSYPATLTGKGLENVNALTALGTTIKCSHDTLTGTLNPAGSSMRVTPTFTECENNRTVVNGGCDFVFNLDTDSLSMNHHDATFDADLECGAGQSIVVHAFTDATHTTTTCTVTIGTQTDLVGTPTVTVETGHHFVGPPEDTETVATPKTDALIFEGTVESIDHQLHGPCAGGGTPNLTNGVYHFKFTVDALDKDSAHNGLRLST